MKAYMPEEKNLFGELMAIFLPIFLIFAVLFVYFSIDKKMHELAKAQLAIGYFLDEYVPTLEERLRSSNDRLEIIETVAPIYERRVSELENWREQTCFVTCGTKS